MNMNSSLLSYGTCHKKIKGGAFHDKKFKELNSWLNSERANTIRDVRDCVITNHVDK